MSVKFMIGLLSFSSAIALAENESQMNEQNYDLIQEYFETTLDENQDDLENSDTDDNRLNRFVQAEEGEKASDASPAASSEETPADDAEKTKKSSKKKKKKKKSSTDNAETSSGHGTQDSGKPYFANADLGLTYSSQATTRKYSDKSLKDTETEIDLNLKYLLVLGKIEIGPLISYVSTATKEQLSDSASTTSTVSGIGFGAAFVFNLGNIHQDKFVPYGGLNVYRISSSTTSKTDGTAEEKSSQSALSTGIELGGKYFVGGHVALKPFLSFDLILSGDDKNNATGTELVASVTGTSLAAGFGMATYF